MDDRISALPDEVLCHILSFLPIKFAFATSILSKRWTSLCHSLTSHNFYYNCRGREDIVKFVRLVNKVKLFSRQRRQPVINLAVRFHKLGEEGFNLVNEWVEAAKRYRVESLYMYTAHPLQLSPNILRCRTLAVLKLSGNWVVGDVSSVDLPSLKSLGFSGVCFKKNSDSFKKLLYGAPILEDLHVECVHSKFPYTAGNKILPKLIKVYFHICPNTASALKEDMMKCQNNMPAILSPVFPNLMHIELFVGFFYDWNLILEVLHQCPRLQNLVIKKEGTRSSQHKLSCSELVPECVSSHLRTCFIGSFSNYEDNLRFVLYILENARFLQAMTMCLCQLPPTEQQDSLASCLRRLPRISPVCKISVVNCKLNTSTREPCCYS